MRLSKQKLFKGYYKLCQCGCRTLIQCITKNGSFAKFKQGHPTIFGKNNPSYGRDKNGMNNPNYKFGRIKLRNYWYLTMPDYYRSNKQGRVYEHVYFYEQYHQCCLLKWAEIHHIIPVSEDYCNNMPWNLMAMMKGEHQSLHNTLKSLSKQVPHDNY